MNKEKKSPLTSALDQYKEIEEFALNEAKKNLKNTIDNIMEESINKSVVKEEITIQADSTTIKIDDNGNIEVEPKSEEVISVSSDDNEEPEITVSPDEDEFEIEDDMNIEENEIEAQAIAEPVQAPEVEMAPVAEEVPIEGEAPIDSVNPLIQPIMDQLTKMMSMMGGSSEGEVDVIDDQNAVAAPEAAPAPAAPEAAPIAEDENTTFEIVDMEDEDDILEIVEELNGEDDKIEEVKMMGHSHTVQRTTGDSAGPENAKENRSRKAMKEYKAQHDAEKAEFIKENESLKKELEKYKNGFVQIQESVEEIQDNNAILALAYKIAISGGLTNEEKIQSAEQFDNCETLAEAEKLFKNLTEGVNIKVKSNKAEKAIKSNSIKSIKRNSTSKPLYESDEVKRWKKLAFGNK